VCRAIQDAASPGGRHLQGGQHPGFIAGKPIGSGGAESRPEATGYGITLGIVEAAKDLGVDVRQTRASVQGFGNVA
jgi:glutamate dehydrogenase